MPMFGGFPNFMPGTVADNKPLDHAQILQDQQTMIYQ
jgi:hypothetical protein